MWELRIVDKVLLGEWWRGVLGGFFDLSCMEHFLFALGLNDA
jgi:hypothetical protein